jgi:EpsI family protein
MADSQRDFNAHHWLAALFMVGCVLAAWAITPSKTWFDHLGRPVFDTLLPRKFGDWEMVPTVGAVVVDPQLQEAVDNIYSETVSRTYRHLPTGREIMLSAAYGDRQTFSKQLHRPESCYSSQGFKIESLQPATVAGPEHPIDVMRMTASHSRRQEQVTYFIRVGDSVISGPPRALNIARLEMGLKGYISDGLLFRVSELADSAAASNPLQDQFLGDLFRAVGPAQRNAITAQGGDTLKNS